MIAFHCDNDDCDSWGHRRHFLVLKSGKDRNHFCTVDCLMLWAAANSEPTESVDA